MTAVPVPAGAATYVRARAVTSLRWRDDQLIGALADSQEEALAELWRRHGGAVYGLSRRMCGPERGEELAQDVFLALWNKPERYDSSRGSLRSYLLLCTHGRAVDLIRSDAARAAREGRAVVGEVSCGDVEQEALGRLAGPVVRQALTTLPKPCREAIFLAYCRGLTYRQVAVELQRPEGTVKSQVRSGLAQLRQALGSA